MPGRYPTAQLPPWMRGVPHDPYWQQAYADSPAAVAPGMRGKHVVDPPVGESFIQPRGAFHAIEGGPPQPRGGLVASEPMEGPGIGQRVMGGLRDAGRGVGRAVDAYGAGTQDARLGHLPPREAAGQRLGDLGWSMLEASGPTALPQGFGPRLGRSVRGADAAGTQRRGEARKERGLDIAQDRNDVYGQSAMLRAMSAGGAKPADLDRFRKEYLAQSKNWSVVREGWSAVQGAIQSGDTGMSDQALLFSFIKIIDPGSVVRDGERKALLESLAIEERFKGAIEQHLEGKGPLPEGVRGEMLNVIQNTMSQHVDTQTARQERYGGLAGKMGYDPSLVAPDLLGDLKDFKGPGAGAPRPSSFAQNAPGLEARFQGLAQLTAESLSKPGEYIGTDPDTGELVPLRVLPDGSGEPIQ